MPQAPPTRRRWFQFSLGTMLLLMTLLCVWLAWQVRIVRERQALMAFLKEQGGTTMTLKDWRDPSAYGGYAPSGSAPSVVAPPQISVPFWRQWMGDEPIVEVVYPPDSAESDIESARAAFPEAEVKTAIRVPIRRRRPALLGPPASSR